MRPLLLALLLGAVAPASAATFTVTTTADTNDGACDAHCSLREALAVANANADYDELFFAPSLAGQTITLALGQLEIDSDIRIEAPEGGLTIDAAGASRVLFVSEGSWPVELVGLTITGGADTDGDLYYGWGAGIYGLVHLIRCTVTGNTAALRGGGVYAYAVFGEDLIIEESTISGNSAPHGGGIALEGGPIDLVLENSTVTANDATAVGGGVSWFTFGGTHYSTNSIIAGNTVNGAPTASTADCSGPLSLVGSGGNVFGAGTGCPANDPGAVAVDPSDVFTLVLDPTLADNGGPTPTHALVYDASNPALDIGGTCGPTDQRGLPAPVDGPDADATPECDAGAVEQEPSASAPVTVTIAPVGPPSVPAGGTFRYAVELAVAPDGPSSVELWVDVAFPNGNTRTVKGPLTALVTPGSSASFSFRLRVPSGAGPGSYTLTAKAGSYPSGVEASDALSFTVTRSLAARGEWGSEGRSAEEWVLTDESGRVLGDGAVLDLRVGEEPAAAASVTGPSSFALHGARPNPFAGRTTLAFDLPEASRVRLAVYDALGREVALLLDGPLQAGPHEAVLDGSRLPSGTYLVRLEAGGEGRVQRVTLVR